MKKLMLALPLAAALAACGGGGARETGTLKIVGSSTVYPFTTAVAEEFQKQNPGTSVIVESTGTGSGIQLFCAGIGAEHPDMVNASRRMKASELQSCRQAGVDNVIEVPIGIDGLTLIAARGTPPLNLTTQQIYEALAANPYGEGPNRAQTWADVDPSLPDVQIRVLGPPPTSGSRDSLNELIMEAGCASNPEMEAVKERDEDRYDEICTRMREDGAFVEAGENDNLLVQKVAADPGALGVLGFSFLEENADKVQPVSIAGVAPTTESISTLDYPGARRLFVYVKGEHMRAKPMIAEFIQTYAQMWGSGGVLQKRGLVPLSGQDAAAANAQATAMKPLQASELE